MPAGDQKDGIGDIFTGQMKVHLQPKILGYKVSKTFRSDKATPDVNKTAIYDKSQPQSLTEALYSGPYPKALTLPRSAIGNNYYGPPAGYGGAAPGAPQGNANPRAVTDPRRAYSWGGTY